MAKPAYQKAVTAGVVTTACVGFGLGIWVSTQTVPVVTEALKTTEISDLAKWLIEGSVALGLTCEVMCIGFFIGACVFAILCAPFCCMEEAEDSQPLLANARSLNSPVTDVASAAAAVTTI